MDDELTTAQAAKQIGVSAARIRQLILEGKLKARLFAPRMLLIEKKELARYQRPKMGRPATPKEKNTRNAKARKAL